MILVSPLSHGLKPSDGSIHRGKIPGPGSAYAMGIGGVMTFKAVVLYSLMALLLSISGFAGSAKETGIEYPLQYEGGSLPMRQNRSVKAVTATGELVFMQRGQRFVVPATSITEIACGYTVRRRFGAAVLGLVPLVDLDKVEEHYVGLTWSNDNRTGSPARSQGVLFKLSGGEYREFLDALERLTGKRAVDANKTPVVVHYKI
jgi:hypothetical protein